MCVTSEFKCEGVCYVREGLTKTLEAIVRGFTIAKVGVASSSTS